MLSGFFRLFKGYKLRYAFFSPLSVQLGALHKLHSFFGSVVLNLALIALCIGVNAVWSVIDDKVDKAVLCLQFGRSSFVGRSNADIAGADGIGF